MKEPRLLVVTGGHPFEREPFCAVFDALAPGKWTHIEQPAAAAQLNPSDCAEVDVIVFYDMPGIRFTRTDPPTEMPMPSLAMKEGLHELMAEGTGLVFLHHAIAGWPAWETYAHIVGGRFHYQPGELDGVKYPDSGYRFNVTHRVEVIDQTHPICDGLGEGFSITDELYLYPVLTDKVVPLLRTTFPMSDASQFYSADLAIRGARNANQGWTHPDGSDLVGWVKHSDNSPVVYLQFGDGPETYADPNYRRVLSNAIGWAASPEARQWAQDRAQQDARSCEPDLSG
jgi:uncharacterized protein